MAGELTINIAKEDLDRLDKILYGLGDLEKSAIIEKGLRDATAVLLAEGRRTLRQSLSKDPVNVAKRTGRLERSFTNKVKKKKMTGYAGFKRPEGAPAHLLDAGTNERWTKSGAYRGRVTATRFWTKAVNNKAIEAIDVLFDSVEQSMLRIVDNEGKVS